MNTPLPPADMSLGNTKARPATTNPLGVKGCGEAGCAGSPPSVMNAAIDALVPCGVRQVDMPATPQAIWKRIHQTGETSP